MTTLDRKDVRWRNGLPVTSPARTLLDLAGMLEPDELEAALANGLRRGIVRAGELRATLARAPGTTKGIGVLRELVENPTAVTDTRSKYERKLRRLIEAAELPQPQLNVHVEGHLVDAYWSELRLVVEFDGFTFHGDRRAFESDRERDQRLVAAGHVVTRITKRQLDGKPYAVVARLAAAVALRRHGAQLCG